MKFINSAAKAFDGLCSTVDALASASNLLTGKIEKELATQQALAHDEIKSEVTTRKLEIISDMAQVIAKHDKMRKKNSWAFAQAERVLAGKSIQWEKPETQTQPQQTTQQVAANTTTFS